MEAEFQSLRAVSARVGADPALVQAAGGNTSIKSGGQMWIKASGTWLARALDDDIFVGVDLTGLLAGIAAGDPPATDFALPGGSGLRPSIETAVHALMPQRVVLHVHCVETIAWAVRPDAGAALAVPLDGLDWAFVPYIRPGLPLARAIAAARRPGTDVVVLGNHGLVVAGDTVATAEALLADVVRRLALPVRAAPAAAPPPLPGYRPVSAPGQAVAMDPARLALTAAGSLYPDHVIFLGPAAAVAEPGDEAATLARLTAQAGRPPQFLVVPGVGAYVPQAAGPGADALAACLADVTGRIAPGTPVGYLGPAEEDALLNWDAERYRQAMSRR